MSVSDRPGAIGSVNETRMEASGSIWRAPAAGLTENTAGGMMSRAVNDVEDGSSITRPDSSRGPSGAPVTTTVYSVLLLNGAAGVKVNERRSAEKLNTPWTR